MENMLQWGLSSLQTLRHLHMTDEVFVGMIREGAVPLLASFAETDAQTVQNKIGIQSQMFNFLFRRSDLLNSGIKIQRGLRIWHLTDTYEIAAVPGKLLWAYNDPLQLDVMIHTIKVESDALIAPNQPYPHSDQDPHN